MYIAQVNYNPLFNAKQARGNANQTQYASQSVNLQKKGFLLKETSLDIQGRQLESQKNYMLEQRKNQTAQLVLQGASLLLDVGQKIYGMYETAQTQQAKTDMVQNVMPAITQRRIEAGYRR